MVAAQNNVGAAEVFVMLLVFGGILALYMAPTLVAYNLRSKLRVPVLVVNLFAGWTVLGWVAALAMAVWPGQREEPSYEVGASAMRPASRP